jgi:hypothetical protein
MGANLRSLMWLLAAASLSAQVPQTSPAVQTASQTPKQDALPPITTLHVYMDLIQVPVLALDFNLQRLKPIDPSRFLVSLDSGPQFRPKHVRQEGDDPITLGILLDPTAEPELMQRVAGQIAALAPGSLHARDHVTIFALDCVLGQTLTDAPADPVKLKVAVDSALAPWFERRKARRSAPCLNPMQLWDAMGFAMQQLAVLPGRRVLLAMTNGADGGSSTNWRDLKDFAQIHSIAVFGLKSNPTGFPVGVGGQRFTSDLSTEDPFNAICQLSGGMIMRADYGASDRGLARFIATVRERYILEFARARNDTPGHHSIDVKIVKNNDAYVRPAGVTILLSPKEMADDPNTIPRDTTDAPVIGNRKALAKPKGP